MSKKRFSTDRQVATLSPRPGQKQTEYYHSQESGLILRVGVRKKAWVVNYILGDLRRKYTLPFGYPDMSLADAVKKCRDIKSDAAKGIDHLGNKQKRRTAATVTNVMDHYFKETPMATKSYSESKRITKKDIIPMLGGMKAVDLTRRDVKDLHGKIIERGSAVMANRTIELLRRAYNCAHEEELIDHNPYPSLKKIKAKESARDRVLKDFEIKKLWGAMEAESPNMRNILRLLLLLGQRSMETMSMRVEDIDQERKEWTVPATQTKTGKANILPIPPLAWEIIKPRLKNANWIFPSAYNTTRKGSKGDGCTKSTKDSRRRLRKATGIKGWTGHDLRRTCRTIMSREGVAPHVAEQVLGHAQGGIEGIYDQHAYLTEKAEALRRVERRIKRIVGLIDGDQRKIVMLRRAG